MNSKDCLSNLKELSFIIIDNEVVVEVSQPFIDMTEYLIGDLLNKNKIEIFRILRVGPNLNCENIDERANFFLFTKSLEVRFISIEIIKETSRQIYVIEEKPNSRLEDKYGYFCELCSENVNAIAIYSVPDLTLLRANQTYLDLFASTRNTPKSAFGKQIYELARRWKGSPSEEVWREVIATGKQKQMKEYKQDKLLRGATYWDALISPLKEDGKVKYIVSNIQDVTERVLYKIQLEEKNRIIKEQNEKFQLFVENMADGLLLMDKHNNYIMLNQAAKDSFYHPEEMKKKGDSLVHTKYYDTEGNKLGVEDLPSSRIFKGETVNKLKMKAERPDKTVYYSSSGRPVYDEEGNIEYAVLSIRDITDIYKYELEIKERKELLEAILDNMQESLLVFDKDNKYVIMNKIARERFSIRFNEIGDGYRLTEFYDLCGNRAELGKTFIHRVKRGETVKDMIFTFQLNGIKYYTIITGTPILDEKGELLYGVLSGRNITEFMQSQNVLKEMQRQLLQTEKEKNEALEKVIEMKDEFLSIISHEFRTPLNVISAAIQAMIYLYGEVLPDKVKEYVSTIRQNVFRQMRLVNNLLDITRANAGRIKIHNRNIDIVFLTKAIIASVHTYASQKNINITFASSIGKMVIGIDDEKYERILLNLLSNAIKFTPEGNTIHIALNEAEDNVCIEVQDNGIGIPEDKLDVIFERFGQVDSSLSRQAEGTGIGLSLVKRFVEALDGSITVRSIVGKGTTFTILLPNIKVLEESNEKQMVDLLENRLVQVATVEFSDVYF